ncbi:MAG: TonB-dependent receptor [Burkholderiales bacterium]|nr:TonB-dependent receptor [Burkholderiales bacterium]
MKKTVLTVALAISSPIFAADDEIGIYADRRVPLPAPETGSPRGAGTADTASLLEDLPGISLYSAGGLSSLPSIRGLADDRIRIRVDGMDLISACSNHMNPPLSYIDPSSVGKIRAFAGVTPVSMGGDSIAGTIEVQSVPPRFAAQGTHLVSGETGAVYRSNGSVQGYHLAAGIASDTISLRYSGSTVRAKNYLAGGAFKAASSTPGSLSGAVVAADEVGSSSYQATNHQVALGLKSRDHLVTMKAGVQSIPHQGFPNQRMDMSGNDSTSLNLGYHGKYSWGILDARIYDEHTRHSMNFVGDKQFWYGALFNVAGMPMDTEGRNSGFRIMGTLPFTEADIFRSGVEYRRYRRNDWWNPVANSGMMMSPNVFRNINAGKRDRTALFAEWERNWNRKWTTQSGIRFEQVAMDTGNVQGYSPAYAAAANAFNATSHARRDNNLDLTLLARFAPDRNSSFEAGYAMKTRSPNLYERYVWANSNSMVMNMNNWFGDGNCYVGNQNLKPEVAHTLNLSAKWQGEDWQMKVSPYHTWVRNYIDAVACPACAARADGFANLSLANQSARLYGVDLSGWKSLGSFEGYGNFRMLASFDYERGSNGTTGNNLYHIMPPNATISLEDKLDGWTGLLQMKLVSAKTRVDIVRREAGTGGYGLLNLYASREWKWMRIDFGIRNLFDKFYIDPLGGAYLGQGSTMGATIPNGSGVPGMGRSIDVGLTFKF